MATTRRFSTPPSRTSLEEELRNRERNEALLALDREMSRYRAYLGLSPDVARGVLRSLRAWRVQSRDGGFAIGMEKELPDGLPPASLPEARARVSLRLDSRELGQSTLDGGSGLLAGGSMSVPLCGAEPARGRDAPALGQSGRLVTQMSLAQQQQFLPNRQRFAVRGGKSSWLEPGEKPA